MSPDLVRMALANGFYQKDFSERVSQGMFHPLHPSRHKVLRTCFSFLVAKFANPVQPLLHLCIYVNTLRFSNETLKFGIAEDRQFASKQ